MFFKNRPKALKRIIALALLILLSYTHIALWNGTVTEKTIERPPAEFVRFMRHLLATYTFHIDALLGVMCCNPFRMEIIPKTLFLMFWVFNAYRDGWKKKWPLLTIGWCEKYIGINRTDVYFIPRTSWNVAKFYKTGIFQNIRVCRYLFYSPNHVTRVSSW